MRYKTIVLELLQDQYPALHEQLRQERTLLSTLDHLAIALKDAHVAWMNELRRARPDCDSPRSRARPWNWRSSTSRAICPPSRRRTKRTAVFPGRGDGVCPQTYAARVSAARAEPASPSSPSSSRPGSTSLRTGRSRGAAGRGRRFPFHGRSPPAEPAPGRGLSPPRYSRSRPPQPDKPLSQMMFFQGVKLPFLRLPRAPAA